MRGCEGGYRVGQVLWPQAAWSMQSTGQGVYTRRMCTVVLLSWPMWLSSQPMVS
jgi:hypothetical protein